MYIKFFNFNSKKLLLCLLILLSMMLLYALLKGKENSQPSSLSWSRSSFHEEGIIKTAASKDVLTIAAVACGPRLHDTMMMIKSVLLFNQPKEPLHFIIFADDSLMPQFREKLNDWTSLLPNVFTYDMRPLEFPKQHEKEWRKLFKPCAAQRLFLPSLLPNVDSLLYVDTDILFLSPVSDIWKHFHKFNSTQISALTPEHESENSGWYNRFARHPFYGRLGVNSGVMLMNLTRMREFDWETQVHAIYTEYKLKLTWGDQDIINIIFYFHPEKLYVMDCPYNYRPDHCMYENICNVSNGIKIMHGSRGYFHRDKVPLFRTIFETIERYQLNSEPYNEFLFPLKAALSDTPVTTGKCNQVIESSIKIANQLFSRDSMYVMDSIKREFVSS